MDFLLNGRMDERMARSQDPHHSKSMKNQQFLPSGPSMRISSKALTAKWTLCAFEQFIEQTQGRHGWIWRSKNCGFGILVYLNWIPRILREFWSTGRNTGPATPTTFPRPYYPTKREPFASRSRGNLSKINRNGFKHRTQILDAFQTAYQ